MTTGRNAYTVYYTEQGGGEPGPARRRTAAGRVRQGHHDAGPGPFAEPSRPTSSTGDDRTIRLTQNIPIEYTVSVGRLLILIVEVFSDRDIFVTGE